MAGSLRVLGVVGRLLGWALAALLWSLVAVALVFMGWFMCVGPAETEGMAALWLIVTLVVSCPALLLTAYLGGFWDRLFPA